MLMLCLVVSVMRGTEGGAGVSDRKHRHSSSFVWSENLQWKNTEVLQEMSIVESLTGGIFAEDVWCGIAWQALSSRINSCYSELIFTSLQEACDLQSSIVNSVRLIHSCPSGPKRNGSGKGKFPHIQLMSANHSSHLVLLFSRLSTM